MNFLKYYGGEKYLNSRLKIILLTNKNIEYIIAMLNTLKNGINDTLYK